ncbi:hypothetical protein J4223_03555 [Candidatus Woesearchaeota archaeon]|nr:hypothetical protein [Candidatus Woesearchaeota archaeon]
MPFYLIFGNFTYNGDSFNGAHVIEGDSLESAEYSFREFLVKEWELNKKTKIVITKSKEFELPLDLGGLEIILDNFKEFYGIITKEE